MRRIWTAEEKNIILKGGSKSQIMIKFVKEEKERVLYDLTEGKKWKIGDAKKLTAEKERYNK